MTPDCPKLRLTVTRPMMPQDSNWRCGRFEKHDRLHPDPGRRNRI
jgi:hypothetical protein